MSHTSRTSMLGSSPDLPLLDQPMSASGTYHANHLKGIPLFAYLMGMAPRTAHIRRFSVASMRVLLFLQHEINELEIELTLAEKKASTSGVTTIYSSLSDFRCLKNCPSLDADESQVSESTSGRPVKTQYEIFKALKERLKEYEEAILRFRTLAAFDRNEYQIRQIQRWLSEPGFCDQQFSGVDSEIWGSVEEPNNYLPDLIPVCPAPSGGPFAEWFKGWFIRWLHRKIFRRVKREDGDSLVTYSEKIVDTVVSLLAFTITASLVYIGIFLLEKGGSRSSQILVVVLFTTAAAICTAVFANEKLFVVVAAVASVFVALLANNGRTNRI
ncbi:hypothetical protein GQ43DRAFT_470501 [Delitschia confertaspora ATCC 74209]|uniref:DUF6594 domain-containing protein n=1 Tax=Delitschia confertaspora ATCC 74209 TaxID=1513339 RepID=A0A9P4JPK3_9PLEO|nr:hypothetical protein GQ43DRAFT_470501 [Delitschia confertaspora ATCC 74209]